MEIDEGAAARWSSWRLGGRAGLTGRTGEEVTKSTEMREQTGQEKSKAQAGVAPPMSQFQNHRSLIPKLLSPCSLTDATATSAADLFCQQAAQSALAVVPHCRRCLLPRRLQVVLSDQPAQPVVVVVFRLCRHLWWAIDDDAT
ncbi:hypothetical protein M0R45_031174 [Rubus argutus]|uniref:Uncharacterized protein n=1 Tax=Rubus argutus TaxID=59490 RepID=A0AAW1WHK2_RUBAR